MKAPINIHPSILPPIIGIFDSGSGGLSVLKEVLKQHTISYVFFADTAHLPYGQKNSDYLLERGKVIARFFKERSITTIIVACHTFSATVLHLLRELFPDLCFIDMLMPTVYTALLETKNKKIGVLATSTTIATHYHKSTLQALDPLVKVVEQACPAFVPLVEQGAEHSQDCFAVTKGYVESLQQASVDTVILGCTHYVFLIDTLIIFLPQVHFVSAATVVPLLFRCFDTKNDLGAKSNGLFVVTGDPDLFALSVRQRIVIDHPITFMGYDQ